MYPPSSSYSIAEPCLEDVAPADMTCMEVAHLWSPECQTDNAALADDFTCGCMSDWVQNGTYCQRSCNLCSPLFVNSEGLSSGSLEEMKPVNNLAYGISKYQNPLLRIKCESYDVAAVADAVRSMNSGAIPLDVPVTVRVGFHDAIDYNKWSGTGGADGRMYNSPEAWYSESRSVNGKIFTFLSAGTYSVLP